MLPNLLESFEKNGYVIVDNLIDPALFERLTVAADKVTDQARSASWDYVRVVGQMFPPWKPEKLDDIWGVQHLMHYDLNQNVFAEFYGSESLLSFVKTLMSCEEDQLQLELFNLLINPNKTRYEIAWHRDAIPLETPEDLETELLKINHYGCQWNTALYDDESLIVVPGSHLRPRTPEERKMIFDDLNCKLPNQLVVKLKPGQTVFYNNNILHRAVYPLDSERKRRTLHACIGLTVGGSKRADNLFQHGLEWLKNEESMKKVLPPRLIPMYERLLCLANKESKRKQLISQGDKLKWGIVGTGQIANKFIKALVESNSQNHHVVAIASSSDLKKAQTLKDKFEKISDICYCYGSYAELCADKNVDVVYIATPHNLHFRDALQALNFGKNVIIEKCFTLNKREAEILIEKAKEKGLFVMEAMWTRFLPVSTIVLDALAKLGNIAFIQSELCFNFKETNVNSRVISPALGGGALLDLGVYALSWCTYLSTKISGKLQKPKISSFITKSKLTGVDESTSFILNYEESRLQCVVYTSIVADTPSEVRIFGENGFINIIGGLYCPKKIELHLEGQISSFALPVEGNGLIYEADHAYEMIKKGLKESPILTLEETLLNMEILDTVRAQNDFFFPGEQK